MNKYNKRNNRGGTSRKFSRPKSGNRNKSTKAKKGSTINPKLFVKKAVQQSGGSYSPKNTFHDFGFCKPLHRAVTVHRKFTKPTAIQDQGIPVLLEGKDIVGIANTGTGKTATFLLPLIEKVIQNRSEKVLIIAPTRELAEQINDEFNAFTQSIRIRSAVCIGGVSKHKQIGQLKNKPNFVIGTPGRLKDLNQQKILHFHHYTSIVLDEVDMMMDMGFLPDVTHIVDKLPRKRHSLFFSATLPTEMQQLVNSFLTDPVTVSVAKNRTSKNVDQDIVKIGNRKKHEVLHELLSKNDFEKVLVFGRTKWGVEKLTKNLAKRGHLVASIHGNKTQNQRKAALNHFKKNKINTLLATDVAARGLDISGVTHVINFDVPDTYETYIHRIGRTGRADKTGSALTFVE